MASGYDVTIKLYQNHIYNRKSNAALNAINVLDVFCSFDVFCSCYSVCSTVSPTIVQLLCRVNNLLTSVCKNVNDWLVHYSYTIPKSLDSQS